MNHINFIYLNLIEKNIYINVVFEHFLKIRIGIFLDNLLIEILITTFSEYLQ